MTMTLPDSGTAAVRTARPYDYVYNNWGQAQLNPKDWGIPLPRPTKKRPVTKPMPRSPAEARERGKGKMPLGPVDPLLS